MIVRCICVVRDERDVLPHSLDAALRWAGAIYVYDHGSTDGSTELLEAYAARDPRVVLAGRGSGPFRDELRGEVANRYRAVASLGDWWCRLDADEIYVSDPRPLLARVPSRYGVVLSESIQYYFTDTDLHRYERDPGTYERDWSPALMRHYLVNWSEERFVRHDPGSEWDGAWPAGFWTLWTAPVRIPLRHYQYRSPQQIQRRLETRLATEGGLFGHERAETWIPRGLTAADLAWPGPVEQRQDLWKTRIVKARALHRDDGGGIYHTDPALLPEPWGRRPAWKHVTRRASMAARAAWKALSGTPRVVEQNP